MTNSEEWRTIPQFPEYEASDLGRIRRKPWKFNSKYRLRKAMLNPVSQYLEVLLCVNYKKQMQRIHRLVGSAFLDLKPDKQINHKDGDKKNNALYNLEVCDGSHNMLHAYRTGLREIPNHHGIRNPAAKLTDWKVLEIRVRFLTGATRKELEERYQMSRAQISKILSGKSWSHLL